MNPLASTPPPPYYAVIFTSLKSVSDDVEYSQAAERMAELAATQPGYLGIEHVSDSVGAAITVSYWSSLEAIQQWRQHSEHLDAQMRGRKTWYDRYFLRVCRVERDLEFDRKQMSSSSRH